MTDKTFLDLDTIDSLNSSDRLYVSQGGDDKTIPASALLEDISNGTPFKLDIKEETSTNRILTSSDDTGYISFINTSPSSVVVSPQSQVNWKRGAIVYIKNSGNGVSISSGVGVIVNASASGLSLTEPNQIGALVRIKEDEWDFVTGGVSLTQFQGAPTSLTVATLVQGVATDGSLLDFATLASTGTPVDTAMHNTTSKAGGAKYIVKTLTQAASDGDVIDGSGAPDYIGGNHALSDGVHCAVLDENKPMVSMFGVVGDGVKTLNAQGQYEYTGTDDSTALQLAVNYGKYIRADDGFNINLNGSTVERGLGIEIDCNQSSSLMNGTFNIRENSGEFLKVGDWNYYDVSVWYGAINSGESNHAKKIKIGKVFCEGNNKYRLLFISDMQHDDITINMLNDGGSEREAMGWAGIYDSSIGVVRISGYFAMGFETITSDGFASKNTTIKRLVCDRNPSAVSVAGKHGFYVRHNYALTITDGVVSTGYDVADAGVSNCWKFRDNQDCYVGPVLATTINISSDGNEPSGLMLQLTNNTIHSIDTRTDQSDKSVFGDTRITTNSPGSMTNNKVLHGFYSQCTTSGNLISDPEYPAFTLSGQVILANEGNLQLDDIVFRNSRVKWLNASSYYYNRVLRAYFTEFMDRVETNNTSMVLENCTVNGDIRLDLSTGTQSITLKSVTCTGEIYTNSLTSRTVNATWWNVTSGQNRPSSSSSLPDGLVDFKSVFFQDGYYLDQTTFVTPYV